MLQPPSLNLYTSTSKHSREAAAFCYIVVSRRFLYDKERRRHLGLELELDGGRSLRSDTPGVSTIILTCAIAEQSRAEQSRAEQSRAEQSRAEQSRAQSALNF